MLQKNEAQERAINKINGQLMLVSCPGSGKTATMLRRIGHMIDIGIRPESILMVTFTDAAATEMRNRFRSQYGDKPVTFCTIHSLCVKIMHAGGIHDFHIMDPSESDAVLRDAASAIGHYFDDYKDICSDIGLFKNTGSLAKRIETSISEKEFHSFLHGYEQGKKSIHAIDFDDLLVYGKRVLSSNSRVLQAFRNRFRYIICDEYQDTNPIQKEILYLIAGKDGNICVVGDDDQSIYGFRGAVPNIMFEFEKDYPGADVIHMDTNYRSAQEVIKPASLLIRFNENRYAKDINAGNPSIGSGAVEYTRTDERGDEMKVLTEKAARFAEKDGFGSIAVLARTNAQLEQVADMFTEEGIPFSSRDVVKDVYEHWIFSDIRAYLRLADGSGSMSDFIRVCNRPKRYIKPSLLAGVPFSRDAVLRALDGEKHYVTDGASKLFDLLDEMMYLPFGKRVDFIYDQIGYSKYLDSFAKENSVADISLRAKFSVYIRDASKFQSLTEWESYAAKRVLKFHESLKKNVCDGVTLATMHRSKGLEWQHVFIIDCCAGILPYEKDGACCDVEEERRLFYVACTRAKQTLDIMYYSSRMTRRGKASSVAPSMFLREMRSVKAQAVTKKERDECVRQTSRAASNGFGVDDLSSLKVGQPVRHMAYGSGTVMKNANGMLVAKFKGAVKMFRW